MIKQKRLMILLMLLTLPVLAEPVMTEAGVVTVSSANGFSDTVEQFKNALEKKGIKMAFELDHQANGARVDEALGKTHLLMFGNPKLGTPLMRSARNIGIDLPLKVLIWEDGDSKTFLTYNDPQFLAQRHAINDNAEIINKMSAVLKMLTEAAATAVYTDT
jgi:uncharacterized protein (DUF302 family)